MPERLLCPACGPAPAFADIGAALLVDGLHRCAECRGVLASHRAVEQARRHVMSAHPALQVRPSMHRCRRCQHRAELSSTRCAQCEASLALACPRCHSQMASLEVLGIVVDVCRSCELTFFDAGAFAHACSRSKVFAEAARRPAHDVRSNGGAGFGVHALDVALCAPDAVGLVAHGARAAGHAGVKAASLVVHGAAPVDVVALADTSGRAALGAAQAATDAPGAGEMILEVVASLFDGL